MRNTLSTILAVAALCLFAGMTVAAGNPPPVVDGNGATLQSLAGTSTLVSVALKDSSAVDKNLRVVELGPDYVAFLTQDNQRIVYLFSAMKEIKVQDGKVSSKRFTIEESRSLKMEEQQVLDRAFDTARRIYETANADQALKMRAAVLLASNANKEAHEYLKTLAGSNDLETQLDAALCLYLVGDNELTGPLVTKGIQSGNRKIKGKAMKLAGLVKATDSIPVLAHSFQDRLADICSPAAKALARMDYAEIKPTLVDMLTDRSEEKSLAAAFALKQLGDKAMAKDIKAKLDDARGEVRHRIIVLLFALDDPAAKEMLNEEIKSAPTLAGDAAILLAKSGDWNAVQFLSEKLKRRYDEVTEEDRRTLNAEALRLRETTVLFRAKAATALVQAGDATAETYLQEMLRSEDMVLRNEVCDLLGQLGKRKLITVLQSSLELSAVPAEANAPKTGPSRNETALAAASAVVAIARPDFRQRLYESRD